MSIVTKALWVIERNSQQDLTLEDIARACGVSKYHLAHTFGQITGQSVMDVVRWRRLSDAARQLAAGAGDILQVAITAGYESHEAFTRAFKARFGLTPETVRGRATTDDMALLAAPTLIKLAARDVAPVDIRFCPPILAVGLRAHYSYDQTGAIAGQWQHFMSSYVGRIPAVLPGIPLSIVGAADDAPGTFTYISAVEVTRFSDTPDALTEVRIPAARWAVFEHRDHITAIGATFAGIFDRWLPDQGHALATIPFLERHMPTFDPRTGLGGIEIWVPLA